MLLPIALKTMNSLTKLIVTPENHRNVDYEIYKFRFRKIFNHNIISWLTSLQYYRQTI